MAATALSETRMALVDAMFGNTTSWIPEVAVCCDPNKSKVKVVALLYIFASLLSLIGAGSIIICSLWNRIANFPEVHPLFHLTLANFMLALTWFVGGIAWVSNKSPTMKCFYVEIFGEMFLIMSFFLTVNYGVNVYIRLRERTHNLDHLNFSTVATSDVYKWIFRGLYAACWTLPIITVTPLIYKYHKEQLEMKDEPSCSRCLLLFDRPKLRSEENMAWSMYDSILLITCLAPSMTILLVLYIMTERIYRKCLRRSGIHTDSQRKSMTNMRKRIFLYVMVFIFCWTPALCIAITDVVLTMKKNDNGLSTCKTFVLQSITAPLQGFLNSIVYGWTRKSFRRAAKRKESNNDDTPNYGTMKPIT